MSIGRDQGASSQTTPIHLAYQATACAKHLRILSVQVVKPGSGG
jgi:hypothetical protein